MRRLLLLLTAAAIIAALLWLPGGPTPTARPPAISAIEIIAINRPSTTTTLKPPPTQVKPAPPTPTQRHQPQLVSAQARTEALTAATTFAHLFARRATDDRTWWNQLAPLMTPKAVHDYQGTDPRRVWFSTITGPAHLLLLPKVALTGFYAVIIPTDAGNLRIELITTSQGLKVAWIGPLT